MKTQTQTTTKIQPGGRIGKNFGSVMNWMMSSNKTMPKVGEGATVLMWSDRHAYEVMKVSDDFKEVIVQQYLPERTDSNGQSESQSYKYEKLCGHDETIVWRNGAWRWVRTKIEILKSVREEFDAEVKKQQQLLGTDYKYQAVWDKMLKPLFDESGMHLKLVEGKTKIKKSFPKVSILWGVKDEYYDPSF